MFGDGDGGFLLRAKTQGKRTRGCWLWAQAQVQVLAGPGSGSGFAKASPTANPWAASWQGSGQLAGGAGDGPSTGQPEKYQVKKIIISGHGAQAGDRWGVVFLVVWWAGRLGWAALQQAGWPAVCYVIVPRTV